MSVIRKKPFIDTVVDGLSEANRKSLISVMNSAGNNVSASLLDMPAKGITPVLFKLDESNIKTGILIYTDDVCLLIAYHRFQDLLMFELFPDKSDYRKVNEYLDINELRRVLTGGDSITSGEIDSGLAPANKVLASDGDGGAHWVNTASTIKEDNVESGDAVKLFGFDEEGNLVQDDIPEGILVDQTVIEDSENAVAGGAVYDELADIKGDITDIETELETKANVDGNYPTMTVGAADNLTPYDEDSGTDQEQPFLLQGTGCGNGEQQVDTGALALLNSKNGNSVVVNQWAKIVASDSSNGITFTSNNDGSYTINGIATDSAFLVLTDALISGHKYYAFTGNQNVKIWQFGFSSNATSNGLIDNNSTNVCGFIVENGTDLSTPVTITPILVDLTQMFGSNDHIPPHLLRHPEDFFRYYQGDLSYNTGELVNSNGRYLKTIGRNQWDEETELGGFNLSDGSETTGSNRFRSKNYIKVIPNETYYFRCNSGVDYYIAYYDKDKNYISPKYGAMNDTFTTPENCCYIRFYTADTDTYAKDITISIYYEGESGYDQYYPYEELANIDTGTETLRSAGSVSDSKAPDGTITRRIGYVDLGNAVLSGSYYRITLTDVKKPTDNTSIIQNFNTDSGLKMVSMNDIGYAYGEMAISNVDELIVYNDVQPSGTLYYELATPTTEQGTPFSENVAIDDFGSMDFAGTNGVPQGNSLFYAVDYKAFIDTMYNYTKGTPSNIALKSDLSGLVAQEDLSNEITDSAGLTYSVKKAYKTGKVVNIMIVATNGTGSQINADTVLFSLGNLKPAEHIRFVGTIGLTPTEFVAKSNDGSVSCGSNLPDTNAINITISYIVS